ncbi:replication protein [Martelella alba]|uniref:Replication protein n=1 Tax=Martelella alba TaxID=2590451 RepID=A0ABY2SF70_9HYPH|nr:replication protein [Martelella alba]TKI03554.1 replication protein [Martelella alba]
MSNTAEIYDFNAAHQRRSSRMENQRKGHFALFRSLLSTDWAKDTAKLALWVRMLGEATHKPRTVEFAGKNWNLNAGQLVTTPVVLARKLRDSDGNEKSAKAVTRMLGFFIREGMISTEGTPFGTVITITNYADYQGLLPGEPSVQPSGEPTVQPKPRNGAGLEGIPGEPSVQPSGEPTVQPKPRNGAGLEGIPGEPSVQPSGEPTVQPKPRNGAGLEGIPGEPSVQPSGEPTVQQNKKLLEQEINNNKNTLSESVRTEGVKPAKKKPKPSAALPEFDRIRLRDTWNCKAGKFGIPKIRSITTTTENGLKRLWASYIKQCHELGREPRDVDTVLNGYLEQGYQPTAWACGGNPEGKKYGIDTALRQEKIDQILGMESDG